MSHPVPAGDRVRNGRAVYGKRLAEFLCTHWMKMLDWTSSPRGYGSRSGSHMATRWIVTMKTFLLGTGWATVWYLVHYVLLWPLWGFYAYFRDFKPGAGPQGGEAIVALMIVYIVAVAGVALLNGIVMIVAARTVWWMRFLVWPLGLPAVSAAAVCLALFIINDYAGARHGTSGRVAVGIGVIVFAIVFLGANFSALAKVRG
jgi:hypothetical protein